MHENTSPPLEVIRGGSEIEVHNHNGERQTLLIRKVSHTRRKQLLEAVTDELKLAELCTGLTESDLDNLTESSYDLIVDTAREINQNSIDRMIDALGKQMNGPLGALATKIASSS